MVAHLTAPLNSLTAALARHFPRLAPPPRSPELLPTAIGPFDCFRPQPLAHPDAPLPAFVAACPVAQKYRVLLGCLDWAHFPERPTDRPWPGSDPAPRASFVAAYLVKLHEQKRSMGALRTFLVEHPALVWLLGFKLVADPTAPHGFNGAKSVPQRRQLNRVLRDLPNDACQFLLDSSVQLIRDALPPELAASFGDVVAGDTKHLLAWVKENNPKQYIKEGRFDPKRQPKGDPDCTLGVKKRRNLSPEPDDTPAPTPTTEAVTPSHKRGEAEYYWGYASGVVASIIPGWGEVVLAERTRPFNESDISYFFPLMQQTERRLGRKPRFGAWDTAFDAFYVYEYFHTAGGFAAVPVVHREKTPRRQFTPDGQPLCAAGLAMPRLFLYHDRTSSLVAHQREKCGCPLLHPTPTGENCPSDDPHFAKGGCTTTLAASIGARLRWQLDRESDEYRQIFDQRTVCERVNSQAVELGIERPKLRNRRSITNQNTLLYVLLNVQALQRICAKRAAQEEAGRSRSLTPLAA
ncbi:MAG: transposase [Kouleothrix sp.]